MKQKPGQANDDFESPPKRRIYFQLGWEYTFEYDNDSVYFAYSLPYTFSMVTNLVTNI